MSKSLGNVILIKDFIQKYSANMIRLLCIRTHYRSGMFHVFNINFWGYLNLYIDTMQDDLVVLQSFKRYLIIGYACECVCVRKVVSCSLSITINI